MIIDILVCDGSPNYITPEDIYRRGIGGAELALFSFGEVMSKRGHEVNIYNTPDKNNQSASWTNGNGLNCHPKTSYNPDKPKDVIILFRGPQNTNLGTQHKKLLGWSCDQYTFGDYLSWYNQVDKMVLISEFHKQDHLQRYKSSSDTIQSKSIVLDLGVRTWEYQQKIEKIKNRIIFCSVPRRGLDKVANIWKEIKFNIPDASLLITSDYTLWGQGNPDNMEFRLMFSNLPDVNFLGNIPRYDLVKYQLESEVHLYPCVYDENFCIANAETQVAGNFAITSKQGALDTTNFTGISFPLNDPEFDRKMIGSTVEYLSLSNDKKMEISKEIKEKAQTRFDWERICDEWEKIIYA